MNIQEAIKENTVIHCRTKSEAIRILNMAHELGYKWNDGRAYTDRNYWGNFKNRTCYDIKVGLYDDCGCFEDAGYKIINSTEITDMKKSTDWTPAPEDLLVMNNELTITSPEGYEIDKEKSTFQKIVFRKIKPKFPTKLEEIDRPWYIDIIGDICKWTGVMRTQAPNRFTSIESAEQTLKFIKFLAFRDAIWEIEGKPENEEIDIIFKFKTPEGLAHFYKMKKEIELGNL